MNFDLEIKKCLEVLRSGGTLLYPTDTVWGIGCDSTNEKAVDKIFNLKKRLPYSLLMTDTENLLMW